MQRNLSAEKDARQNEKRRTRNRVVRSHSRTLVKDFVAAVEANKKPEAAKMFVELASFLDNAVTKGVLHKNTGSRKVSRLAAQLKKLAVA